MLPPIRFALFACLICACMFAIVGCSDAYGCPPAVQQFNAGCQVQAQQLRQQVIVAPQAVYAAPLVQQQVIAQPYYQQQLVQQVVAAQHIAQPVIVQQVRQHRQAIVVQQVRQPRVQVQRSVIRTR